MQGEFILTNPMDMHLHLREGKILEAVAAYTQECFLGGVVMPNLKVPITKKDQILSYREEILTFAKDFIPLMSIYLTEDIDPFELEELQQLGVNILKLYPRGATTHSESGLNEILSSKVFSILCEAERLGMTLSVHGEGSGFSLDREYEFLHIFEKLTNRFPKLHIVIEHMSDARSIRLLHDFENITATLTLHHMSMDLDSLLGKNLNPHHFCKPILKTPADREALLELALSANKKVSFGSDSAPHALSSKQEDGAAGVFSAPKALPQLCQMFEKHGRLENLQAFVSDNAVRNYKLKLNTQRTVILKKTSCRIPERVEFDGGCIVPFNAGMHLSWDILSTP